MNVIDLPIGLSTPPETIFPTSGDVLVFMQGDANRARFNATWASEPLGQLIMPTTQGASGHLRWPSPSNSGFVDNSDLPRILEFPTGVARRSRPGLIHR